MIRTREKSMERGVRGFLLLTAAGTTTGYGIYFWFPEYAHHLVEEDHLVENLSSYTYLLAFFFAAWAMIRYEQWRLFTAAVCVLSLVGYLSEVSFGETVLEMEMPVVYGVKVDAAHDLVMLIYVILHDQIGKPGIAALVLLATVLLAIVIWKKRSRLRKKTANIHRFAPGHYLGLFLLFLGTALVIDLKEHYVPYAIAEELFELYAGIALCLYSASLAQIVSKSERIGVDELTEEIMSGARERRVATPVEEMPPES